VSERNEPDRLLFNASACKKKREGRRVFVDESGFDEMAVVQQTEHTSIAVDRFEQQRSSSKRKPRAQEPIR
jgi:hypothetical protein